VKLATKGLSGWSIQTVISNTRVSLGNVVVDSRGHPRFTYTLNDARLLMYASWNGSTWNTQTIDKVVHQGNFIALDSNDNPHITYTSTNHSRSRPICYAVWNGTIWDFQPLNYVGSFLLGWPAPLVLDRQGNPHIAYLQVRTTGFPYYDGTLIYATSNQPVLTSIPLALWAGLVALAVALAAISIFAFKKRQNRKTEPKNETANSF
jgi:hypothetical protein